MKTILSIYLLTASLAFFSCSKDAVELPAATETGANTFGCKIDLLINARNFSSSPTETEFEFFIKAVTAPGTYLLNTTVSYPTYDANYAYYVHRKFSPDNEWITSAQYTGSINFTKVDTVNHIVSGSFAFHAINMYNAPQPLNVTEGRFDIKTQ
jgi:hypothetical protein